MLRKSQSPIPKASVLSKSYFYPQHSKQNTHKITDVQL